MYRKNSRTLVSKSNYFGLLSIKPATAEMKTAAKRKFRIWFTKPQKAQSRTQTWNQNRNENWTSKKPGIGQKNTTESIKLKTRRHARKPTENWKSEIPTPKQKINKTKSKNGQVFDLVLLWFGLPSQSDVHSTVWITIFHCPSLPNYCYFSHSSLMYPPLLFAPIQYYFSVSTVV